MTKTDFVTPGVVVGLLRQECERLGSARAFAHEHKFSVTFISEVLRGSREPSDRLAKCLGYRRIILFTEEDEYASKRNHRGQHLCE